MFDVVIIGGGIIGALTARELAKYSIKVAVLEKESDVCMGASKANSGIVHSGYDATPGTLKAKFNVLGNSMMEGVCKELNVKFKRNGSLVVGNSGEEDAIKELYERGKANGVKKLSIITGDEARELEPSLSKNITLALNAASGGIVCPYQLTIAAMGNAMDNGVTLIEEFCVSKIEKQNEVYFISDGERQVNARIIINAAGINADEVFGLVAKPKFEICPRRGEYLLFDKTTKNMPVRTIFQVPTAMGKGILVSPTVDGNFFLGPTSENITDKTDKSVSYLGIKNILANALKSVAAFDNRNIITSFTGLRASSSTGDFIIEETVDNFINVAGIESPGLTAAPAIAECVASMAVKKLAAKTNSSFNGTRKSAHWFNDLTIKEKNEVIKFRPDYGRIVCRCEEVTEGEIVDALRANPKPKTVDGIKRRTRAGMGRCQGGFCLTSVMELIARERGIKEDSVTKKGKGSEIILSDTK